MFMLLVGCSGPCRRLAELADKMRAHGVAHIVARFTCVGRQAYVGFCVQATGHSLDVAAMHLPSTVPYTSNRSPRQQSAAEAKTFSRNQVGGRMV